MAITQSKGTDGFANAKGTVPDGETGLLMFSVSPGKRVNIAVKNPGAAVFDVVFYLMTATENSTRQKFIADAAVNTDFSKSSVAGFLEIGIDVTTAASGAAVEVEILECKQ